MKKVLIIGMLALILDQSIKLILINNLSLNSSITIIDSFFSIVYVNNYGAAFSILQNSRFFLIIVALVTLFCIYFLFIKNKELNKFDIITFGLLIGGIIGNLLDRIIYGYVIDFLEFKIFDFKFPIFNFADIFIVVSALLIVFKMIGEPKDENV